MVPETGLEPAHLTAYAPKAYVYTNFTTRAKVAIANFYIITYFSKKNKPNFPLGLFC